MKIRSWIIPTLLLNAISSTHLAAQTPDSVAALRLDGVAVTVSRDGSDRSLVTQRVEVVEARLMFDAGAIDVADGLRSTTPIDVITYPGLLTGVSIRGFRPQITGINPRTLLLVNGRPAGTTNLSLLPLAGVESIEVLRGPASALYGSSAMGGVVNVITSQSRDALAGTAAVGYGSFDTYEGRLSLGGRLVASADFDLALSTSGQRDGYRTGSGRTFGSNELRKIGSDGTESTVARLGADSLVSFTEFRSWGGLGRIGTDIGAGLRLDLSGDIFIGDNVQNPGDLTPQEFDGRSVKDVQRTSLEAALSGDIGRHSPLLRVYRAEEKIDYFNAPVAPNYVSLRTPTRTVGGQFQDVVRIGPSRLTVGADATEARTISEAFSDAGVPRAPYNPNASLRSAAAFVQARGVSPDSRIVLNGGLRMDRVEFEIHETPLLDSSAPNQEVDLVVSPNAGARFNGAGGLAIYTNIGRSFVAPEIFSVAGYSETSAGAGRSAVYVTQGNPGLRPETGWTWDAGIAYAPTGGLDAEIGYFRTRVNDRIASTLSVPETPRLTAGNDTILAITSYENVDEGRISGLEGRLSYEIPALGRNAVTGRAFVSGTRIFEAVEQQAATGTTRNILNVADLTLIAGVEAEHDAGMRGRLSARYVGGREDSDYVAWWEPGRIIYPAYLVVDFTAGVSLGSRYRVGLEVRNLTDEDYFEVRGYNLPGRNFAVRLEADF